MRNLLEWLRAHGPVGMAVGAHCRRCERTEDLNNVTGLCLECEVGQIVEQQPYDYGGPA